MEDNVAVLQSLYEWAQSDRVPLYKCFVDLSKAYDSVIRSHLFDVLARELGLGDDLVKALVLLYANVT